MLRLHPLRAVAGALYCIIVLHTHSSPVMAQYDTAYEEGCPPGTHKAGVPGGEPFCRWCEPGTYQTERDADACTQCRPGMISGEIGATSAGACTNCKAGTYASGPTQCLPCPLNTISPSGAFDIAECTAGPGFYAERVGEPALECPSNHYCVQGTRAPTPCPQGKVAPPGRDVCVQGLHAMLLLDWVTVFACLILYTACLAGVAVYRHVSSSRKNAPPQPPTTIQIKIAR